jgi:hypothetical protein
MKINLNIIFSLFFTNLFLAHFSFKTDLIYLKLFSLIIFLLFFIYLKVFFNNVLNFRNIKSIIFKEKLVLLSLIPFLLIMYFNSNDLAVKEVILQKNLVANLANINFIKNNFYLLKIIEILAINNIAIMMLISFFIFIIFKIFDNKIDIFIVFIYSGLIVSFFTLVNLMITTYLIENNIGQSYLEYYGADQYLYFQFVPFGATGFRNIEIFPMLIGYICSMYLTVENKGDKFLIITYFLMFSLFLTYSRLAWFVAFVSLLYLFLRFNNLLTAKIILKKFIALIILIVIFSTLWSNFYNSHKLKTNIIYYSLMKLSTLIDNDQLVNYFNKKNQSLLIHFNVNNYKINNNDEYFNIDYKPFINGLNQEVKTREEAIAANNKIRAKHKLETMNRINFHLNSNIERKEIYKQSIDLIKKKPLLGYGQLNFAFLNKSEFKDSIKINKGNAESQFLQLLLENGLFGFFAYFLIYLSIYLSGLNRKGKYLLLFSFTYSFFLVVQVYYFFWIMLFSSLAYKKQ